MIDNIVKTGNVLNTVGEFLAKDKIIGLKNGLNNAAKEKSEILKELERTEESLKKAKRTNLGNKVKLFLGGMSVGGGLTGAGAYALHKKLEKEKPVALATINAVNADGSKMKSRIQATPSALEALSKSNTLSFRHFNNGQ